MISIKGEKALIHVVKQNVSVKAYAYLFDFAVFCKAIKTEPKKCFIATLRLK